MLNIWLTYFLKELLLEATIINLVHPFLYVYTENFINCLRIELFANVSKCGFFIASIIEILQKDEIKLKYQTMDIKIFREIIIKSENIDWIVEKKVRKESIDLFIRAFIADLNAQMWHYSLEKYNITRKEWELKRIKLLEPTIEESVLQRRLVEKEQEWNNFQMMKCSNFYDFFKCFETLCELEQLNANVVAPINTWLSYIHQVIETDWIDESYEVLKPILNEILLHFNNMSKDFVGAHRSLVSVQQFVNHFRTTDARRFSEWSKELHFDLANKILNTFLLSAHSCKWIDILDEQPKTDDDNIRCMSEISFGEIHERLEQRIQSMSTLPSANQLCGPCHLYNVIKRKNDFLIYLHMSPPRNMSKKSLCCIL